MERQQKIEEVYDLLQVDPEGSLYSNEAEAGRVLVQYNLDKLYKPVDRTVWLMPGNLVNACYDPQHEQSFQRLPSYCRSRPY